MITDINNRVASNLALSTTAKVTYTDGIDLGIARDVGEGQDLYAVINITQAVKSAANGGGTIDTVYFEVGVSTDTTPTFVNIAQSAVYAPAQLVEGANITLRINPVTLASASLPVRGLRYLYVRCVVAGTGTVTGANTTDGGKFTCDIVTDIQDGKKFYTSGIKFD